MRRIPRIPRAAAVAGVLVLVAAVAVIGGDRLLSSGLTDPAAGSWPAADRAGDGAGEPGAAGGDPAAEVQTSARRLLVEPSAAEVARSLATLRKLDDHPLYEMTYYGPAPRIDDRPVSGDPAPDEPAAEPEPEPEPAGEPGAAPAGEPGADPAGRPGAAPVSESESEPESAELRGRAPFACTVFAAVGDPRRPLFGRNFDWDPNPALILHANPTGAYRSVSIVDISYFGFDRSTVGDLDRADTDETRRAALVQAVAGPFDGMNEHGLVVGMASVRGPEGPTDGPDAADGSDHGPEVRPGRPAIGSIGIMRLVLDQARTVADGIAVLGSYNIDFSGGPRLHYLLTDATGASAAVEFTGGRMRVVPRAADDSWQVMENFHLSGVAVDERGAYPRYRAAADALRSAAGRPSTDAALDLLREVAQRHTQWSAVYDLRARSVAVFTDKRRDRVHEATIGAIP